MASKKNPRNRQSQFIYDLPYSITRQICCNLDVDKAWEKLASEIGYTIQEVRLFEMAYERRNDSPTKQVLNDWSSRNATARDLYHILQRINRRREMQLLQAYFECDTKQDRSSYHTKGDDSYSDTPSMILRVLDNQHLPPPPSKGSTKASSGAWSTSSMNDSTSMSVNGNVNLNTGDFKGKSTKKHQYKDIPSMNDERFYPSKNHDYLGKMKETSGISSSTASDKKSLSSIKVDECEADGAGESKGDMTGKSMESSWMETLKSKEGYSALAKDGHCDLDTAVALVGTQSFTTKELNHATNGFSDDYKIGEGTFGEVFRGDLKRTKCAIKRLFPKQDSEESQGHLTSELKSLIRYRHENIVPLYGYTLEGGEICLVYQYMHNGSLDDRLKCKNKTRPLSWHQRLEIMKGAACGLQYLHTLDEKPLIHGDIKCSNILLDKHMEAKIGDLGLAKHATGGSGQSGKLTHITKKQTDTKEYQSRAYLPPEVMRGNAMSIKGDTYSFGVVIFEVFTGEMAYDENREGGKFLNEYIKDYTEDRSKCMELIDRKAGFIAEDVAKPFFDIACNCTAMFKKDRPNMVQVHTMLEDLEAVFSQKYTSKCQENTESYCGSVISESMTDLGETRMNDFSFESCGNYQPGLEAHPHLSMMSKPEASIPGLQTHPQSLISKPGITEYPFTEAVRLQMLHDARNEASKGKKLEEQQVFQSDPRKLEGLEFTDQIYQSDMKKLEEIQKFEKTLDIPEEIKNDTTGDKIPDDALKSCVENMVDDLDKMKLENPEEEHPSSFTLENGEHIRSTDQIYDSCKYGEATEDFAKVDMVGSTVEHGTSDSVEEEVVAPELLAVKKKTGFDIFTKYQEYQEHLDYEDCDSAEYGAEDCDSAEYGAEDCDSAEYGAEDCDSAEYGAEDCDSAEYGAEDCDSAEYGAEDCDSAEYGAEDCDSAEYSAEDCDSVEYSAEFDTVTYGNRVHCDDPEDDDTLTEDTCGMEGQGQVTECDTETPYHDPSNHSGGIHYSPSGPKEAIEIEEDVCGKNESKLFCDPDPVESKHFAYSDSPEILDLDLSESKLFSDPESKSRLPVESQRSLTECSGMEASDSQLFCNNKISVENFREDYSGHQCVRQTKSDSVLSSFGLNTDSELFSDGTSTVVSACKNTSSGYMSKLNTQGDNTKSGQNEAKNLWQQQRSEPTEGECFV